ncbi:hypothetical protein PAECIP111892_04288 [Paenibacillus auburnensis]|uniref:Uncharacterized protein n=1 Tax=Paenibacillus auburnensis TaxID=2905649 RepID=A0ABM9CLQ0_9BACL|nr:hypothetical protein [Paenibacillus auburnensis]CAH1216315.1 hypothetical protein PAECIP111892_04288 [Paenibacillus auburnensis]
MLIFLMYMFTVLGITLLLAAAVLQFKLSYPSSNLNKLARSLGSFNLKFPQRYVTPDESHIIALDEDGKTLAIGKYEPGRQENATATLYTFDTILGSEIIENALTLTKVSKTSRITSSASTPGCNPDRAEDDAEPTEEIKELTLRIYLSSADTPVLSIPFLPGASPAKKSDLEYSLAFSEVQHVHEAIRGIVSA